MSGPHQPEGSPRTRPEFNRPVFPDRSDDVGDVVADRIGDGDFPAGLLQGQDFGGRSHRNKIAQGIVQLESGQDLDLLLPARVAEADTQEEPVQLGLRQWKGALLLDGILGGDNEKRRGQRQGPAVDGHLPLFHALQQARLSPLDGAVDFVGEQHVAHHRSRLKNEPAALLVEDIEAGDVRGQKVRGELHPLERAADRYGQRLGDQRLAQPRHILQKGVAVGPAARSSAAGWFPPCRR